jgi:hypothetical protein
MLFDRRFTPASKKPFDDGFAYRPTLPAAAANQSKRLESQITRTRQAFERLDRDERRVRTSAAQILMTILHYAAAQDDPAR